ncbi:MAG: DNA-directed RNA polymerase subunit omega [Phycisphaerales bacterium]|nr:DNA-directed RNA polymerase subunit omega [Phycisphaerales bacterium]
MIEALKGEEIISKAGGRFKLCALVQHRVRELMEGARPLVDRKGRTDIEIAIEESLTGKISIELPKDADMGDKA